MRRTPADSFKFHFTSPKKVVDEEHHRPKYALTTLMMSLFLGLDLLERG